MNKYNIISLILLFVIINNSLIAQNEEVEIFIIDAFVTPEKPHTFKLSFFSSESVKSQVVIDNKYEIDVSNNLLEDHSVEVDFSKYNFEGKFVPYQILYEKENGTKLKSEVFELILPYDEFIETKEGSNPISTILFGMALYLLPSPNVIITEEESYFSLTKELPIVTFYSSGYNYPSGNISLEYSHIYESSINNFLRFGYKHFIPIDIFEYLSPGITGFTNFNGYNGIGAEMSFGLFKVYDVFTVYSRYRFNFKPSETNQNFHEISIGLYSHFFTIDL